MALNRRDFIRTAGLAGVGAAFATCQARAGESPQLAESLDEMMGVLVDMPNCIGCRKCEYACQESAGFDVAPLETFEDKSVFERDRRPTPQSYTVVNRYGDPTSESKAAYVKVNCLHCLDPACVSACLVRALTKEPSGPVVYDAAKCMGCRYCMVACPFQIPAYEYDNATTPQVRKCTMCFGQLHESGGVPACVKICPQDCLIYGKRKDLLRLAHDRIRAHPDLYVDRVYGEHEAGGTSWLYLSSIPYEKLGFVEPGLTAPPRLTEMIQHGIFKHWIPPLALYGLLGIIMRLFRPESPEPAPELDGRPDPDGAENAMSADRFGPAPVESGTSAC